MRVFVSRALVPEGVVDPFAAAGLKKPNISIPSDECGAEVLSGAAPPGEGRGDISILSDECLAEVRGMPQRNLAVELLRKLIAGAVRTRRRKNVVRARPFAEPLEQAIRR